MNIRCFLVKSLTIFLTLVGFPAWSQEILPPPATADAQMLMAANLNGDVRIPLNAYLQILEQTRNLPTAAPAAYAIGQSTVSVQIDESTDRSIATVNVQTSIETFEDEWVLIPILPYGAAISRSTVNNQPVQFVQSSEWLAWPTNKAGIAKLNLQYTVDARRSESGYVIPLPLPRAASTQLTVDFPGTELDMSVVPSSNLKSVIRGSATRLTASIPTTSSVQISWRIPSKQAYVISRAKYQGKFDNNALLLSAEFDVELYTGESVNLPLMSNKVTLNDVKVDDNAATIIDEEDQFTVVMQGRGKHRVFVAFQAPIQQQQGPPSVTFPIPRVPISKFDLQLPGEKELTVSPTTNVLTEFKDGITLATVNLPMSNVVSFSWADAVPKDLQSVFRANANVYHALYAEEGVLHGRAVIAYEVTHGETTSLSFTMPASAQVNRVESPMAGISDWTVQADEDNNLKRIIVFFDRPISEQYQLHVFYEQLIDSENNTVASDASPAIDVPLLKTVDTHRQRGVVALLAGSELALTPVDEIQVTRVGENQLPAFFRNQIELAIVHTFKYTSDSPRITVNTVAPERQQGKYDAQIDTLVSLGEVTMRGSASIQLDVKSGAIVDLQLYIPIEVNVLNVTGPSLRNHTVVSEDNRQTLEVEFTQEMTGQFSLNVAYEKILSESLSELEIPIVDVEGAEVERGRVAVEALTAVEVQASVTEQMSSLEINELPQQLILKTTNPILLAFKYVSTEIPQRLALEITRHQELNVQVAAIEKAYYQTLITDDGLSVTTARFNVSNSRRQFLRLDLPKNSEVWSVFVNGVAEKPAKHNDGDNPELTSILVKMINSVSGFPVEVVYATPGDKISSVGKLSSHLPIPDMVVTHTEWEVYLPQGINYQSLSTNMNVKVAGRWVNPQQQAAANLRSGNDNVETRPLRIQVPTQGILYHFEKLYANQSDNLAQFTIRYSSIAGNRIGVALSILGVVLIWFGVFLLKTQKISNANKIVAASLTSGAVAVGASSIVFKTDLFVAFTIALICGLIYFVAAVIPKLRQWRHQEI